MAFQSGAFQSNAFQIGSVTPPATLIGGGGWHGWRGPTPDERKRYLDHAKRLIAKKLKDEESFESELETTWNRIHGIGVPTPIPEAAEEQITAAVERIQRVPSRARAERRRLMGQMAAMLADLRAEAIAEYEAQMEEEEAIAVLLSAM